MRLPRLPARPAGGRGTATSPFGPAIGGRGRRVRPALARRSAPGRRRRARGRRPGPRRGRAGTELVGQHLAAISCAVLGQRGGQVGIGGLQRTVIRSLTCSPSLLRASWTSRMTSRASPSRRSSGRDGDLERRRSRRRSDATVQPERGVWVTITSSGPEGDRRAVHLDRDLARRPQLGGQRGRVGRLDRRRHRLGALAEPPAERPEVGLHHVVDQVLADRGQRVQRADVELARRPGRAAPRAGRANPAAPTSGAGQRLADRHRRPPRGPTGPVPPAAGPAPSARTAGRRSAPASAAGQLARCTDSRVVRAAQHSPDVIGQERRDRGHQPGQRVQALVQRGERRRAVRRARALPEPPPGPAHVPVRQVVDERGEPPARRGRVETLQRGRDLLRRARAAR